MKLFEGETRNVGIEEDFVRMEQINRERILLSILPGLVATLFTPPYVQNNEDSTHNKDNNTNTPTTFKQNVVSILTTLIGGINMYLKISSENNMAMPNSFLTNKHANLPQLTTFKITEWTPKLITVVEKFALYQTEHHTDWIDVDTEFNTNDYHIQKASNNRTRTVRRYRECMRMNAHAIENFLNFFGYSTYKGQVLIPNTQTHT